ncbi:MAG: 5'-nucleotidase [Spirochaetaceae bacterium]
MPYDLTKRLVIGLSSSALFDLQDADYIFRTKGEESYREYQFTNKNIPLSKGVAFPFIRRLLQLNKLRPDDPLVEVILMSRNDPDTGLRVMNSIEHYGLGITRAIFTQGRSPKKFIPAFDIELFLSSSSTDVNEATLAGYPAGQILTNSTINIVDDEVDKELRIAFDFDGVIADDESEKVLKEHNNLNEFHEHEILNNDKSHNPGPLKKFLERISYIQKLELEKKKVDSSYIPMLRISIVTARNAPSHKRVIQTMRDWNIMINEAYFMGGIAKNNVLEVLRPHIYFDDQKLHLDPSSKVFTSVHIPFGVTNSKL